MLYWAERDVGPERLVAADGAAQDARTLLDAQADPLLSDVTSLVVDPDAERLYWVNAGSGSMQYLDVASGKLTTLESAAGARPAALDVHAGEVLWADAAAAALYACDKDRCAAPRCTTRGGRRVLRHQHLRYFDASGEKFSVCYVSTVKNGLTVTASDCVMRFGRNGGVARFLCCKFEGAHLSSPNALKGRMGGVIRSASWQSKGCIYPVLVRWLAVAVCGMV
ncbi:unnamed protein product [Chrysodeixis includens]|uniref:Uncharacterized protein n=1 Tax=Chrysodeixis includens TaxID=689277 RepID=A0A9N8KYV0_CHRIL|nr:unnamed protein product [Chrysodeixis includens]